MATYRTTRTFVRGKHIHLHIWDRWMLWEWAPWLDLICHSPSRQQLCLLRQNVTKGPRRGLWGLHSSGSSLLPKQSPNGLWNHKYCLSVPSSFPCLRKIIYFSFDGSPKSYHQVVIDSLRMYQVSYTQKYSDKTLKWKIYLKEKHFQTYLFLDPHINHW